tara:strand:+ start:52941 stop:54209 length:1269 start_codon:yes stop_codon:yes gene_type:complete
MPYYKFQRNDVYVNTLKTYPAVKFLIYSGSAYYNNASNISGAFSDPIRLTDAGNVSLYELNIDRHYRASSQKLVGPSGPAGTTTPDKGLIYGWVTKNGTRVGFRSTSKPSFNSMNYGDVMFSNYPLTSSISKELYLSTTKRYNALPATQGGYVSRLRALKNTINKHTYISPAIAYSSSLYQRDLDSVEVGLVSIPTIFYGSKIKPGSVDLKFYYTGSLIGRAQDTKRNGVLYSTSGNRSGSVIGFALYGQGFLVLTASYNLGYPSNQDRYRRVGSTLAPPENPRWTYFAQPVSGHGPTNVWAPNSAFIMEMSGTSTTQTLTMFATARAGDLNQSNNPTFKSYSPLSFATTGSKTYIENNTIPIKNIVSSSYNDPTGSFEKTVYISKIGIYDEEKNLIGVAKLATPVRKTVSRSFTIKIKTDI